MCRSLCRCFHCSEKGTQPKAKQLSNTDRHDLHRHARLPVVQGQRRFSPKGRAGCEWVIQNAQHRQEGPICRPFKESAKINRLIYVECRGMASIRTDSHCAHHRHTLPPQPTEAAVPPPVVSTASNPLICKRPRWSRQRRHHHHQLCKRLVRQTMFLLVT